MVRVFKLSGASEEEVAAMKQALKDASIEFYETPDSNWGAGAPALWVKDSALKDKAKWVIDAAQDDWVAAQKLRREGAGNTGEARRSPRYFFYVLLCVFIAGLTIFLPWWLLS